MHIVDVFERFWQSFPFSGRCAFAGHNSRNGNRQINETGDKEA